MDGRNAEDRHDRVADELLDRPSVTHHDVACAGEVPVEHVAERLGVELLPEHGRVGHVAEHDGDRLAHLAGGKTGEWSAAGRAKAGAPGVVLPGS